MTTRVHQTDLWYMLFGYVRYAMGRMSTAPRIAYDLIRSYGEGLTCAQLMQISDEILHELNMCERSGKTLGMQCDHDTWKLVVETIHTQMSNIDEKEYQHEKD